jgi:hypothetical protein
MLLPTNLASLDSTLTETGVDAAAARRGSERIRRLILNIGIYGTYQAGESLQAGL